MTNDNEVLNTHQLTDDDAYDLIKWSDLIDNAISEANQVTDHVHQKILRKSFLSISHYKGRVVEQIGGGNFNLTSMMDVFEKLKLRANQMVDKAKDDLLPLNVVDSLQHIANLIVDRHDYLSQKYEVTSSDRPEEKSIRKISAAIDIIRGQMAALQNDNNQSRQAILKTKKQAESTNIELSTYSKRLDDALVDVSEKTNEVLENLKKKQAEVNELVGLISGNVVSGSYTKSATTEKSTADSMRNGSVFLMLLITFLLALSLFESGRPHFDLETAIFRFVLTLALSVPAAYLARESSKHRTQQYLHQRISLDLQAITPYIASLPTDEQHRLKSDIASRIFGATEGQSQTDSYPLNLQELLMAAISKLDSPKSEKKEK